MKENKLTYDTKMTKNNIEIEKKYKKNQKGITLVALVVTIVLNCSFLAMV